MTPEEKSEYVGENGYLIKCFPLSMVLRIIHDSQKKYVNGIYVGMNLTILYEKGKTNQDGENKVPRHVFANSDNPAICPILALGLRSCCDRSTFKSIPFKEFSASTSHKSYSSWLRNAASSFSEDIQEIIAANRIGSHSLRKGSATYV